MSYSLLPQNRLDEPPQPAQTRHSSFFSTSPPSTSFTACQHFIPGIRDRHLCLICRCSKFHHLHDTAAVASRDRNLVNNFNNCEAATRRNSCPYDIRAEFVSRENFREKFGTRIPLVLEDDNYIAVGQWKPEGQDLTDQSVYAGSDEAFSDSELTFNEQKKGILVHSQPDLQSTSNKDMIQNSTSLSPSERSAFDDYKSLKTVSMIRLQFENSATSDSSSRQPVLTRIQKESKVSHRKRDKRVSGVSFGAKDNIIGYEGGQEYFYASDEEIVGENDNEELDFRELTISTDDIEEKTDQNTEYNANLENFALENLHTSESVVASQALLIKKSVESSPVSDFSKLMVTTDDYDNVKPTHIKASPLSAETSDDTVVPVPRKPRLPKIPPKLSLEPDSELPLPKSTCSTSPSAKDHTLSLQHNAADHATLVTLNGEGETEQPLKPPKRSGYRSAKTANSDRSVEKSQCDSNCSSISPVSAPHMSDMSSSLSESARSVASDSSTQATPQSQDTVLSAAPLSPPNLVPIPRSINNVSKTDLELTRKLKTIEKDLQEAAAICEPSVMTNSQSCNSVDASCLLNGSYIHKETKPKSLAKSVSASRVPLVVIGPGQYDERSFLDIAVCQHKPRKASSGRAFSLDRNQAQCEMESSQMSTSCSSADARRPGKFSSLRRWFPRFDRSGSHPPGYRRSSNGRASFSFAGLGHRNGKMPGDGIPGLFHSLDGPCCATDDVVGAEKSQVIVKEISDSTIVVYPDLKEKTVSGSRISRSHKPARPPVPPSKPSKHHLTSHTVTFSETVQKENFSAPNPCNPAAPKPALKTPSSPSKSTLGDVERRAPSDRAMEDRYNHMALSHLSTLAFIAEHFPDLTARWRLPRQVDASELRWRDFVAAPTAPLLLNDSAVFYEAVLKRPEISSARCNAPLPRGGLQPFLLPTLAEFQEHIPSRFLKLTSLENDPGSEMKNGGDKEHVRKSLCKVSVLPAVKMLTIDAFADQTLARHHPLKLPTLHEKEACFLMIQLVASLKFLQGQGIEDLSSDLDAFLILLHDHPNPPQLVLLYDSLHAMPNSFENGAKTPLKARAESLSLCQCALAALCVLLHIEVPIDEFIRDKNVPLFPRRSVYTDGLQKVAGILHQEKASSLTGAKALLDTLYWISANSPIVALTNSIDRQCSDEEIDSDSDNQNAPKFARFQNEFYAKLWLDTERAKTVNRAVRLLLKDRASLDLTEQYRVNFLLHASVKQLYETSKMLDSTSEIIV